MVEGGGQRVLRAVVIVAAALAATSVVLWPVAVLALPLLFWAATGGRLARWSASLVAAFVVVLVAMAVAWWVAGGTGGSGAPSGWPAVALALVVGLPGFVAFAAASSRVRTSRA